MRTPPSNPLRTMTSLVPASHILNLLADSLEPALVDLCRKRYDIEVGLRRVDDSPTDMPPAMTFSLEWANLRPLQAHFTAHHLGGNMYEVEGQLEEEPKRSFTYCLPDAAPLLTFQVPNLARQVATYLLDAVERHLGKALLRHDTPSSLAKPANEANETPRQTKEPTS